MSAISDIFTGGGGAADEMRAAAQDVEFNPFNIQGGALGSVTSSDGTLQLGESALGRTISPQLQSGASQFLSSATAGGPFGAAGLDLSRLDQALRGLQAPSASPLLTPTGPTVSPQQFDPTTTGQVQQFSGLEDLLGAGRGALAASGAAREALGDFDPNTFASTQFERLNALAAPQEQTAATQLLERLQGSGRLGVREQGRQRELTELGVIQEQSRNQRLLQALGLAGQEQDRLTQQATAFGGLGRSLVGQAGGLQQAGQRLRLAGEQQQFGQQLAGAQETRAGQQNLFEQLLRGQQFGAQQFGRQFEQRLQGQQFNRQGAFQRFGAALEALGAGRANRQTTIGQALALLGEQRAIQQQPFQLLGQSIGAGMGGLEASQAKAGMLSDAAKFESQQQSQFFSGLLEAGASMMAMSDARLKSDIIHVGQLPSGINIYDYTMFGRRERGVMAQELLLIRPDAVHQHPNGYFMVDYSKVI